jgi:hypothetical protein
MGTKQSRRNINDGKIIVLIESGRISRPLNMSKGSEILALLPLKLTDRCGQKLQDLVVPKEMTLLNIYMQNRICLRRRK